MRSYPRLPLQRAASLALGMAIWLGTLSAFSQANPQESTGRNGGLPNFIVIFCDNLGYGDIEPFGSQLNRTPNLNRMAEEGRKFTHFYATAGVCTPSRASLMTGCYAQRVGMHSNPRDGHVLRPLSPHGLHPNELTIAEVLKQRGYATTIIGKWHLGDQPEFLPTRQGFDSFFGVPYSDDMTHDRGAALGEKLDGSRWPPLPLMENERVIEAPVDRDYLTKRYTQRAVQFIEQHRDGPFFLYLPHAMPGSTRAPFSSPQFKGKSRGGAWGDSIEELDWSVGQILDKLAELEIDDDTLVLWTSDNGAPGNRGSNLPLFGKGYSTAEGAFRVPAIMRWAQHIPAGSESQAMCTTMDVLPTLAALAGAELPSNLVIDGHDIRSLLDGPADAESPYEAFYYYDRDQLQAVRSGPWKLFLPLASFGQHPHFRADEPATALLFNVVDDVGCTSNVAQAHPQIVERLSALAEAARKDLGDRNVVGSGQRAIGTIEIPTPRRIDAG